MLNEDRLYNNRQNLKALCTRTEGGEALLLSENVYFDMHRSCDEVSATVMKFLLNPAETMGLEALSIS